MSSSLGTMFIVCKLYITGVTLNQISEYRCSYVWATSLCVPNAMSWILQTLFVIFLVLILVWVFPFFAIVKLVLFRFLSSQSYLYTFAHDPFFYGHLLLCMWSWNGKKPSWILFVLMFFVFSTNSVFDGIQFHICRLFLLEKRYLMFIIYINYSWLLWINILFTHELYRHM